ncbi:CTP synthase 2 isoform X2 [Monodelphis domestica]|uniref:CTP synthase n=1 Tax=Monodelphis domestica TaxID=13616 RepID=F6XYN7_MONDO|nr:CTP synthase 2 isoform X2 [Monodelphis domestica]XP_056664574.1 CTP synthase 2 isoform X2 [Monodelphis domestica]XP_056664575.1 CTP synthase 2 isoform X2 [Monodelphis domestica]XP_056664576.1 CTP synthase 2 isoform X2 [Monodelphis domestica]
MKYILVTGGVISGIGKGIIASSIGTILKSCGLRVTAIKIDPYINIDAGTFSPYEHGEVFVLNDGGEVDLDLGNYERFLDINLYKDNNITTGKIYQHVINKERHGDYLGKTVQVVPHITDAVQEWVMNQAKIPVDGHKEEPQICVIELGGTIGDIEGMPFVEAFRQFQFKAKRENFCNIHVSLVPQPSATGEQKTKPTQNSVRALRGLGLSPDLIVCRSSKPIEMAVKEKISMFCHVEPEQVIFIHDVSSTYRVPVLLEDQGIVKYFKERLDLPIDDHASDLLFKWKNMADRYERLQKTCSIALVGKYTKLSDCYASVFKALEHSALAINHKLDLMYVDSIDLEQSSEVENPVRFHEAWQKLCKADGILVPGGFGYRGTEGKLRAISWARTKKIPFLGICLGMQLAVVEFARNCLNWKDADSTEFVPNTSIPVVIDMPEHHPGEMGGTMRLGKRTTVFKTEDSILRKLYGDVGCVEERHRHRYEVNPELIQQFEEKGLKFVGRDIEGERMEIIELANHPYFVAVQFHPEFSSRPMKPSPPYLGLLLAATGTLNAYLQQGCKLSSSDSYSDLSDDSFPERKSPEIVTN